MRGCSLQACLLKQKTEINVGRYGTASVNCGRLYNGRSAAFDRNDGKVVPTMWKNL